jgi:diadenosine tetraphosphatase ApaH/serine/threonine PP2A family protein phosphatase
VLTAIFADIHANRQAFEACLAQASAHGAERIVLLGDYVGYGADPLWCTDEVAGLVSRGAICVRGNHDTAIGDHAVRMNREAQIAIEWTRRQLGQAQRQFLAGLPLTHRSADTLFVHADASDPADWNYVLGRNEAAASMGATDARMTFCGHTHYPAVFGKSRAGSMTAFVPDMDAPIQLLPGHQWLIVAGSVGQPRDGIVAACWLLLDQERQQVTFCRAAYDVEGAAAAILKSGLPAWLADRLLVGR